MNKNHIRKTFFKVNSLIGDVQAILETLDKLDPVYIINRMYNKFIGRRVVNRLWAKKGQPHRKVIILGLLAALFLWIERRLEERRWIESEPMNEQKPEEPAVEK